MKKYKNVEVVTTVEIGKEHHFTKETVRKLLFKTCIPDIDYFRLSHEEVMDLPTSLRGTGGYPMGMIFITKSGYQKMMGAECSESFINKNFKQTAVAKTETRPQMITSKPQVESIKDSNPFLEVLTADRNAYVGIIRKQSEQIDALIKLLGKTLKTPIEMPEFKERVKAADWYSEINGLVDTIHNKTRQDRNVILSNAYKLLDSQYGLCIDQYRKEYGEIIHRNPTVIDTLYWVENEKNPNTKGLLSGILENMYNSI